MRINTFKLWTALALTLIILAGCSLLGERKRFQSSWQKTYDRTWVGPDCWANRLQDWRVANGRLECVEGASSKPMRTVHLLTRWLSEKKGYLRMRVLSGLVKETDEVSPDAKTGFLVGAGKGLDYRAADLIHHSHGPGAGLFAGMDCQGNLFVYDFAEDRLIIEAKGKSSMQKIKLELTARPDGPKYRLTLKASHPETGENLNSLTLGEVDPER
ncbi:MAG: hypothetical protein OEV50_05130, partial [Candidatus Aminicenantes bacterium]|nr:hypothetical protein [Candidatus Aminicenantes bacterium]